VEESKGSRHDQEESEEVSQEEEESEEEDDDDDEDEEAEEEESEEEEEEEDEEEEEEEEEPVRAFTAESAREHVFPILISELVKESILDQHQGWFYYLTLAIP
jgi:hypothetical protein